MSFNIITDLFINHLRVEKKYSEHTCISYKNDLNQFFEYCTFDYEMSEVRLIKHLHIRSWIVSLMTNNISPESVNRKISALRTLYKWLLKKGTVTNNPMLKIMAPKKSKRLPVIIQDVNMDRLLESDLISSSQNPYSDARDTFIIDLLYSTGIRRAELVALKVGDINLSRTEIRVLGKGNKVRSIPMTQHLIEAYKKYITFRNNLVYIESDVLFLTEKGKKIYPRLVHTIVQRKLSSVTSLDKKSPHILRHSFATHMLDRGADLNAIKELLGHASLAATQVYTHNSISKLKEAYGKAHPRSSIDT
ncbi:MAG TPA: tyrosine-type recombinase/integrase [Saprospiraceae bacterium]|nr:tyrosine-type recombinase/integrase [Saprospiraceae bacterium]